MAKYRKRLTEEERDKIYKLRCQGISPDNVKARFNCSIATISKICFDAKKKEGQK